jgi:hypothetical protein
LKIQLLIKLLRRNMNFFNNNKKTNLWFRASTMYKVILEIPYVFRFH